MPETAAPIGILGGTFDPIHFGHLRLAEECLDRLGLSRIALIPAAAPNLRCEPRASAVERLAMARLAIAGNERLSVDDREIRRAGMSYTVDTLIELRSELGMAQPLCLILGADAFLRLPAWDRWQRLFELAHVIVAARPGYEFAENVARNAALDAQWRVRYADAAAALGLRAHGGIASLHIPLLEISATDIRARIANGSSARYLAPQSVLDYISSHRLYRMP